MTLKILFYILSAIFYVVVQAVDTYDLEYLDLSAEAANRVKMLATNPGTSNGHLEIYGPEELTQIFKHKKTIKSAYANYGSIPYGLETYYKVHYNQTNR